MDADTERERVLVTDDVDERDMVFVTVPLILRELDTVFVFETVDELDCEPDGVDVPDLLSVALVDGEAVPLADLERTDADDVSEGVSEAEPVVQLEVDAETEGEGVAEADGDVDTQLDTDGEPVVEMVVVGVELKVTLGLPDDEIVVLVERDRVGDAVAVPHADGVFDAIDRVAVFE